MGPDLLSPSAKSFLVAPVSRIMLLLGGEDPQVVPPVVRLVSVYVMDHLSPSQLASELPLDCTHSITYTFTV